MFGRRRLLGIGRTPGVLVTDGDSITATSSPAFVPYLAYPQQASRMIGGGPFALYNIAVSGETITQMIARFNVTQAIADPTTAEFGGTKLAGIYSVMGGVNDLGAGATAQDVIDRLEYIYSLAAAYYDCVVGHTIIGAAGANVTAINAYLRAKDQTAAWRLCDGAANTHIASRAAPWFFDATHLSDVGAGLYGALFANLINSIVGQ